jgi:hypothetical protein
MPEPAVMKLDMYIMPSLEVFCGGFRLLFNVCVYIHMCLNSNQRFKTTLMLNRM